MSPARVVVSAVITMIVALGAAQAKVTKIAEPTVITKSGKYVVITDLMSSNGPAIVIQADNVDLDLDGHVVTSDRRTLAVSSNGDNVTIHDGTIINCITASGDHVLLEDLTVECDDINGLAIEISGNYFVIRRSVARTPDPGGICVTATGSHGIIEDNEVINPWAYGIMVSGRNVRIENNDIQAGLGSALDITCDGCSIINNVFRDGGSGMFFRGSRGCRVIGNLLYRSDGAGIHLDSATTNTLVLQNTVFDSEGAGIRVDGSLNRVENNMLNNNGEFGLSFSSTSTNNAYGGNSALGNSSGGPCTGVGDANTCDAGVSNVPL